MDEFTKTDRVSAEILGIGRAVDVSPTVPSFSSTTPVRIAACTDIAGAQPDRVDGTRG